MLHAILTRQTTSDEGTFGQLRVYDGGALLYSCFTGELPWRDNRVQMSCIPAGSYTCQPWHSRKYPNHYNVMDVPGRSAILFHSGNFSGARDKGFLTNVEGCILVGKARGTINGQQAVLSSRLAMDALRKCIGENKFSLKIQGVG